MFRRLLKILGILLLVLFVIVTLAFTSLEYRNANCKNIEIEYDSDEVIKVDKNEIVRLVKKADEKILGKNLDLINSGTIEKAVEKHEAILNAEVYKIVLKDSSRYKGVIAVRVKHREPVVRIMTNTGNYYLDEMGEKIPVSSHYAANVLVVTGQCEEAFVTKDLLPCVLFIEQDKFWKAQIEQIHVERNGNVVLIPLVGDHTIELGTVANYDEKLRNMKAFYQQVLASNNWNKYKSISLKYKNQVIAKRR